MRIGSRREATADQPCSCRECALLIMGRPFVAVRRSGHKTDPARVSLVLATATTGCDTHRHEMMFICRVSMGPCRWMCEGARHRLQFWELTAFHTFGQKDRSCPLSAHRHPHGVLTHVADDARQRWLAWWTTGHNKTQTGHSRTETMEGSCPQLVGGRSR